MLKKRNRLRLRQEKHFFSEAVHFSCSGFSLFIRKTTYDSPQMSCIVSKKNVNTAVGRHRMKRFARQTCAEGILSNLLPPVEYALILQKNFLQQDKVHILRELQDRGNKVYSSTGK